jgi:phosphohistidine phosphatase
LETALVKRVWLLRHAKSSWDDPALDDHDRPLAPRGRKAARRIARWATDAELRPDLVLSSSALRARSTLELVVDGRGDPDVEIERSLYTATSFDLLSRLQGVDDGVEELLLVGHNPALHELAGILAPPGPEDFPTGALIGFRLEIAGWQEARPGCGAVASFVVPRSLSG